MKMRGSICLMGMAAAMCGCGTTAVPCSATASFSLTAVVSAVGAGVPVADHAAASPGNQVQFLAESGELNTGTHCAVPDVLGPVHAQWTTSDAVDVTVSSAQDATNGLTTCVGTTLAPATLTATYTSGGVTKSSSIQLTCK